MLKARTVKWALCLQRETLMITVLGKTKMLSHYAFCCLLSGLLLICLFFVCVSLSVCDATDTDVVDCFRMNFGDIKCKPQKGIVIHENISDHLTFTIPNITAEFAGGYFCGLFPADESQCNYCMLVVTEPPDPHPDAHEECPSHFRTWTIVLGCAFSLLFLGFLLYIFWNKSQCFRNMFREPRQQVPTYEI